MKRLDYKTLLPAVPREMLTLRSPQRIRWMTDLKTELCDTVNYLVWRDWDYVRELE